MFRHEWVCGCVLLWTELLIPVQSHFHPWSIILILKIHSSDTESVAVDDTYAYLTQYEHPQHRKNDEGKFFSSIGARHVDIFTTLFLYIFYNHLREQEKSAVYNSIWEKRRWWSREKVLSICWSHLINIPPSARIISMVGISLVFLLPDLLEKEDATREYRPREVTTIDQRSLPVNW